MTLEMDYCPPNITLNQIWINHGFSICLLNTIVHSISLGFILIFGIIQLWFYRKYATNVQFFALPYSQLFGLQIVLNAFMPLLALIRLILEAFVMKPKVLYGYMLLTFASGFVCWIMLISLILTERRKMLPSVARHGHGLIILIFTTWAFGTQNFNFLNLQGTDWFFGLDNSTDIIRFALFVLEYTVTLGIFLLSLKAPGIPSFRNSESFTRLHPDGDDGEDGRGTGESGMRKIYNRMRVLAPFIWPAKSIKLQFYVVICFLMLIIGRVTNVYVPLYSKKIVDSMTVSDNSTLTYDANYAYSVGLAAFHLTFRWDYILIYVFLKIIQGGGQGTSGLINILRSMLWISVEQYTTREVQVHFFEHLLNLSLRFHLQRKTGEVLRSLDRGNESINNILNYLVFIIVPTIADIVIAIVYLTIFFNGWFGLIVFTTMFLYLVATFTITEWRTKFRRAMNTADNLLKQQSIDCLLNFETVKYYTNEKYETRRIASAIAKYQTEEYKVTASICVLNMVQLVLINFGLLAGSLLCVWMVVKDGSMTVGDYVLFTSYLLQLYGPLNFFGTYYRLLQRCFIDMENMLQLLKEDQEIRDAPDAKQLKIQNGTIEFRNVSFSYIEGKEVLKDVSFTVPGGKSVALVGCSGGGKTSIVRLLFRFYDLPTGEILIDGQNIQKVTQQSLRQAIGVVPQDTVLFNDTIRQNILYGRIGSDEQEMEEAARAACIHDKVLTFQDGYETLVGERGLKLSGGEKQRVAIARTILKNPAVILLDEATSALDTHTERQIQSSLQTLCENRTSIIVAHRLSTIVNVNQILVLKDGIIAESGTHNELMASGGLYADLWNEQLKSSHVEDLNDNADVDDVGGGGDERASSGVVDPSKQPSTSQHHPNPHTQT